MAKPAWKNKWERVFKLLEACESLIQDGIATNNPPVREAALRVRQEAALYTNRAGTRQETSMGLAIIDVLDKQVLNGDLLPEQILGAVVTAKRIVAREAALAVVTNTQRRYIRNRGRATTEPQIERRNRTVTFALNNVWRSLKKGW